MTEVQKAALEDLVNAFIADAITAASDTAAKVAAAVAAEQDRIIAGLAAVMAAEEADFMAKLNSLIKPV